jgi:hypothetical protein
MVFASTVCVADDPPVIRGVIGTADVRSDAAADFNGSGLQSMTCDAPLRVATT